MTKDQPRRVQEMTTRRKPHQLATTATAVSIVSNDRMPDRGEMYSDLMRASREEMSAKQIGGVEARKPGEVCPGRPSCTDDCHALSVSRIPSDRFFDRHSVLRQMPPRQRRIPPRYLSRLKRRAEHAMRAIRLGDQQEPRGLLIQT